MAGPAGSGASSSAGLGAHLTGVLAGQAHGVVAAQQPQGLGVQGVVVAQVGAQQLVQPGVGGVPERSASSTGQGRHALAQVGARGLAGLPGLGGDVDQVVRELEGDAELLAVAASSRSTVSGVAPLNIAP